MDAILRNRILLSLCVLLIVAGAFALDAQATGGTEAMIEQLRDHKMTPVAAKAKATERDLVMNQKTRRFQRVLDEDAQRFGLQPQTDEALAKPNAYERLVTDHVVLQPGQTFKSEWVTIKAAVEPVVFVKRGAEIRANHALVYVENIRNKPIAYYLDIRSATAGGCDVRGSRSHNAVALLPGEVAEIVVCAGQRPVEIHDLQVMELTPLGFMYVSQVPARAFGHDEVRGQAHKLPRRTRRCSQVPSERLHAALKEQRTDWRDVADYFARHNCDQYPWVWGYRYAEAGVEELPVSRADVEAAAAP